MAETQHKQELGLFADMPIEDYHRGPGISSTALKKDLEAPKLHKAYVDGMLSDEETPATVMGSAVHCAVLEPNKFQDIYAVVPSGIKKPTVAQINAKKPSIKTIELINWWDEFNRENAGKNQIKEEERDLSFRIRDAVWTHPEAKEYFFNYQTELSGWYLDQDFEHGEGTNMLCRYRPDLRSDDFIVDLKTTVSAEKEKFGRQALKMGYHISAAHYLAGDTALKGTTHNQFIIIAVEKTPPYMVSVYAFLDRQLGLGRWERRRALNEIKKCRDEKLWPGYNNDVAVGIEFPPWAYYEYERAKI